MFHGSMKGLGLCDIRQKMVILVNLCQHVLVEVLRARGGLNRFCSGCLITNLLWQIWFVAALLRESAENSEEFIFPKIFLFVVLASLYCSKLFLFPCHPAKKQFSVWNDSQVTSSHDRQCDSGVSATEHRRRCVLKPLSHSLLTNMK